MTKNITHVLIFEGEVPAVFLCYGWADCKKKFFEGIGCENDEREYWEKDLENEDSWTHRNVDPDFGKRFSYSADIGEIDSVRIYAVQKDPREYKRRS
jgi:hypothetical protein